jgi:hypothetical protein
MGATEADARRTVIRIHAGTDNQAAEFLSVKRGSTKWPLTLVMMQRASTLKSMRLEPRLNWRPRELNVEADALTNLDTTPFSDCNRIPVDWPSLSHSVLDKLVPLLPQFLDIMTEKRSIFLTAAPMTKRYKTETKSVWQ